MIENKRVVAVVLARGGSKGIPNKNLAVVNGRSLLQRAIEAAAKCSFVDAVYVSSDSEEILKESQIYGGTPIRRPVELASDTASSAAALEHALLFTDDYDYAVESMCTSPFKTPQDVSAVIKKLHTTGADSVVGVARVWDHHPARLKYIVDDVLMNFFPEEKESRRQDLLPAAYVRNGSLYAFTQESFMKYRSRYGGVTRPYIMDGHKTINIDEPHDLLIAQLVGEKYDI